jgi:ketosteroid isomerase-like protein
VTTSTRTPQEVFQHHGEALMAGDLEGIVSDYADDAVIITPDAVRRGKDGVREAFTQLLSDVPDAEWEVPTQVVEDGIDTFVFRDGMIRAQTVRYTLIPSS